MIFRSGTRKRFGIEVGRNACAFRYQERIQLGQPRLQHTPDVVDGDVAHAEIVVRVGAEALRRRDTVDAGQGRLQDNVAGARRREEHGILRA